MVPSKSYVVRLSTVFRLLYGSMDERLYLRKDRDSEAFIIEKGR